MNGTTKWTPEQIAAFLGCTTSNVKAQYAKNARSLSRMADKAEASGSKVNGFDAATLRGWANEAKESSR